MEQQRIDMFLAQNAEKLPKDKIYVLQEALAKLDDAKAILLQTIDFKEPSTVLLLSILFGGLGVDRFLLGKIGLGILKLLTCGGCLIWWIIDIIIANKRTRKYNYKKLQAFLMTQGIVDLNVSQQPKSDKLQKKRKQRPPLSPSAKKKIFCTLGCVVCVGVILLLYFTSSFYKIRKLKDRISYYQSLTTITHTTKYEGEYILNSNINEYVISDIEETFEIQYPYEESYQYTFEVVGADIIKHSEWYRTSSIALSIHPGQDSLCFDVYAVHRKEKVKLKSFKYAVHNVELPSVKIEHIVPTWQDSSIMYIGKKESLKFSGLEYGDTIELKGGVDTTHYKVRYPLRSSYTIIPHDTCKSITVTVYRKIFNKVRLVTTETYVVKIEKSNEPKGAFSVGHNKYVYFAPGNLQYQPSTKSWRFAPNEWDRVGNDNRKDPNDYNYDYSKKTREYPNKYVWHDLFGYGASGYNGVDPIGGACTGFDIEKSYYDWGRYVNINNSDYSNWRTPTYKEMSFLFYDRPQADKLYSIGTVNGVHGLIVLPDNWKCPNKLTFTPKSISVAVNSYFDSSWSTMQNSGAIFLPAAGWQDEGYRYGSAKVNGYSANDDYECGCYWTSTCVKYNIKYAYTFTFGPRTEYKYIFGDEKMSKRCAVRLIRDVK